MKQHVRLAIAAFLAVVLPCLCAAQEFQPNTGVRATTSGGTGATSIGCSLSNSGGVFNTSQCPDRTVVGTTDTITSSDAGTIIVYNSASPVAVGIASAASAGLTQGFAATVNNINAGVVTITPSGSTINSASSFAIPANTGCIIRSNGTNYLIDFSSCSALPISAAAFPTSVIYTTIGVDIDGSGSAPSTGLQKSYYQLPAAANGWTILGYSMTSDVSGSAQVDVWANANAIPTISNTITGANYPTLTAQQYVNSTTLTSWTTALPSGSVLGYSVVSASTLTHIHLTLFLKAN